MPKLKTFINKECPSNDVDVAILKKRLAALDLDILQGEASAEDIASRKSVAVKYELAKDFLCQH